MGNGETHSTNEAEAMKDVTEGEGFPMKAKGGLHATKYGVTAMEAIPSLSSNKVLSL